MKLPKLQLPQWCKSKPAKALVTTVIVLLMVWVGRAVVVNTGALNPLSVALEQFEFSDIYFHWHRGHNAEAESDLVLVDIRYLHDREEIATLLDSIAAHEPRLVALDVIFPPAVSLNAAADSHLSAAVAALGKKVVLAQNAVPLPEGGWRIEQSFMVDNQHVTTNPHTPQPTQGFVNLPVSVVRTAPTTVEVGDTAMPSFAAQVALLASGNAKLPTDPLIDFGGTQLQTWTVVEEGFSLEALRGRIVFVGDMGDLRDHHTVAAGSGGRTRLSGSEVHARATAALLSPMPYRNLPRGWSIAIQILLIYLFCWLLFALPQTMDNWVHGALQLLFIVALLPVCYVLFVWLKVVCAPTLALVGFGLAALAKNIVDVIPIFSKK
ncbi:MAG: CHASE2 domain-containing protein [Bacteroidales bacterium]|nr:CHASE2 domain-containing protein [Bacteroidales bacterium]